MIYNMNHQKLLPVTSPMEPVWCSNVPSLPPQLAVSPTPSNVPQSTTSKTSRDQQAATSLYVKAVYLFLSCLLVQQLSVVHLAIAVRWRRYENEISAGRDVMRSPADAKPFWARAELDLICPALRGS